MTAPTTYEIDITLSTATLTALSKGGYYLYVLHATKMTDGAAMPIIWEASQTFGTITKITWGSDMSAYCSSSPIVSGKAVSMINHPAITGGQTLKVAKSGIGTVKIGGPADMITIENQSTVQFASGLACANSKGTMVPYVAAPLYGKQSNQSFPLPQALLNFSTKKYLPGTVIKSLQPVSPTLAAFGTSLLVDLTSANKRKVGFDINKGWSWGKNVWGKPIAANADLSKILIQ